MLALDSWIDNKYNKTAIYCSEANASDIESKKYAVINDNVYLICGYDVLTSITGNVNIMLLLDTTEHIECPVSVELRSCVFKQKKNCNYSEPIN